MTIEERIANWAKGGSVTGMTSLGQQFHASPDRLFYKNNLVAFKCTDFHKQSFIFINTTTADGGRTDFHIDPVEVIAKNSSSEILTGPYELFKFLKNNADNETFVHKSINQITKLHQMSAGTDLYFGQDTSPQIAFLTMIHPRQFACGSRHAGQLTFVVKENLDDAVLFKMKSEREVAIHELGEFAAFPANGMAKEIGNKSYLMQVDAAQWWD